MSDSSASPQIRAMRLIFEFEGENVRLVMQQPVDTQLTGVDVSGTRHEGFFVDTRDAAGRTLARVAAHGAFSGSAEVFPERPGEPITRVTVAQPRGAFTVIVPVPPGADHVRLVQVRPAGPDAALAAVHAAGQPPGVLQERELARFPLRLSR